MKQVINLSYILVDPFDGAVVCIYPVSWEYDCVYQKMEAIKDADRLKKRGVPMNVYGCVDNCYSEHTKIYPRK